MTAAQNVTPEVAAIMNKNGVPAYVWEPIAMAEDPSGNESLAAYDSGGLSFGLFQLHVPNGQGSQWKTYAKKGQTAFAVLENPQVNTTIAAEAIAPAYKKGKAMGLTGQQLVDYTATHSGHPTNNGQWTQEEVNINQYYQEGYGRTKNMTITYSGTNTVPQGFNVGGWSSAVASGYLGPVQNTASANGSQSSVQTANNNPYSGLAGVFYTIHHAENTPLKVSFLNTHLYPTRVAIVLVGLAIVLLVIFGAVLGRTNNVISIAKV